MPNLSPSQEPVAWYAALGVLLNAIMVALFIFGPSHGLTFDSPEEGALLGVENGVYLLIGAVVTRQAVTPTAPAPVVVPAPTPPTA